MINNYEKHNLKKSVLGASIMMVSIAGMFSYSIQSVRANELSKIEHVKTEYFNTYISQVDDPYSSLSNINFVKLSDIKDVNFVKLSDVKNMSFVKLSNVGENKYDK